MSLLSRSPSPAYFLSPVPLFILVYLATLKTIAFSIHIINGKHEIPLQTNVLFEKKPTLIFLSEVLMHIDSEFLCITDERCVEIRANFHLQHKCKQSVITSANNTLLEFFFSLFVVPIIFL